MIITALMLSILAQAQTTKETCPRDTVDGKVIYRYQVEKSIGLWRISQTFGVSQEDIINANPQLKERGIHVDEILLIPGEKVQGEGRQGEGRREKGEKPETEAEEGQKSEAIGQDTVVIEEVKAEVEETIEVAEEKIEKTVDSAAIQVGLLLPLQAKVIQRDQNMDRFVDFYEGALLAVNDVQKAEALRRETAGEGRQIVLKVFDTEKTDLSIKRLIADSALNGLNVIIGPVYPAQVAAITEFSKEHNIPTLIPFSDNVPGIENNPAMMQFNATEQQKAKALVDYLQERNDSVKAINCVFVEARDADIPSSIRTLRSMIRERQLPHTYTTLHQILADSLYEALNDTAENVLIFNTEKYGNLQMLMPHVINGKGNKKVVLMSQFSWQKEKIVLEQIYTSVFATDMEQDLTGYEAQYDQYFGHEHAGTNPRYDLLGYDLMRGMLAMLMGREYYGFQSDIKPEKLGETGGYVNAGVKVIRK